MTGRIGKGEFKPWKTGFVVRVLTGALIDRDRRGKSEGKGVRILAENGQIPNSEDPSI